MLLPRRSRIGIGIFDVGMAEVPIAIPAARLNASSHFERTCVISVD